MKENRGSLLGATMLVAGTTIGAGMLALPVATGKAGFFPSLFMILLGWFFMTTTALFLAEVNLWMEEGVHIVTMASRLLGRFGKILTWLLFLFISYASLVAYISGCGDLLQMGSEKLLGFSLSPLSAALFFVILFGFVIYLGNVITSRVNTLLMVGLILSYVFLIAGGFSHVHWENLKRMSPADSIIAVPLLLTVFSFQTIVPSLTLYLKRDAKKLRLSIILGTTMTLIFYLFWQILVLGTVLYDGDLGLARALAEGKPATEFLCMALHSPWVASLADFFAFFALVTSFLGMGLGLFDFLADSLKIKRTTLGKAFLGFLVAIPPLFFALTIQRIFLLALDVSGGIGDAILNGMIPALMLWIGRYRRGMVSESLTWGGKPLIIFIMAYALFVFTIEILGKMGLAFTL